MPKRANYNSDAMEAAIKEAQKDGSSLRAVAKMYGVPRSSLQFRLKNPGHKETYGPCPVLTNEEELTLVRWIRELARKGFPRKKEDILASVQGFLVLNPRPNPFKDNRPGEGWFKAFLRRHPDIVERTSEAVTAASSCVSEADIRKWFEEVKEYVRQKKLEEVFNDPSRIFNGDETGFHICPSTGKVLALRGSKNVYSIDKGSSKENITVMFTFSADGTSCCPMVVYPYKRIPEKISESVPSEWGIARSDNGWMTAEVFFEYIANVFHPFLLEKAVKFPVVLFVDGHKSHLTYQLSVLCSEVQIEVIALYPNATRILQPADVAVFRPVKIFWRKAVREWHSQHPGEVLNKVSFGPLLKQVIDCSAKPETLVNGFKACGLYPLNPDAVDYSKCLGNLNANDNEITEVENEKYSSISFPTFLNIVGKERVEKFKNIKDHLTGESEDFFTLFRIWEHFQKEREHSEDSVPSQGVDLIQHENNCQTPQRSTLNSTQNEQVCAETVTDQNCDITFCGEPSGSRPNSGVTNSSSVVKVVRTQHMSNFLVWPETPKRKGKRQVERQPYAVTSKKYQEMFEKKRLAKKAEEKEKEERKRKREEGKQQKMKELPNPKRILFQEVNKSDLKCHICLRNVKIDAGLRCDECKKVCHESCVPKGHRVHIPISEDGDNFLCHVCFQVHSENSTDDFENIEVDQDEVDELYNYYLESRKKDF